MAKRTLTPRQLELREAQAELKAARRLTAIAKRRLESLSKCDWCGARVRPTGLDEQLCGSCGLRRMELRRVALLRHHGYGPEGRAGPRSVCASREWRGGRGHATRPTAVYAVPTPGPTAR